MAYAYAKTYLFGRRTRFQQPTEVRVGEDHYETKCGVHHHLFYKRCLEKEKKLLVIVRLSPLTSDYAETSEQVLENNKNRGHRNAV